LIESFKEEQIKKLQSTDKNACLQFILPKAQGQVDDMKVLSAYLTESLVAELERVQLTIGYTDFLNEVRKLSTEQK